MTSTQPLQTATMNAITQTAYGPPEVLVPSVVSRPALRDDGVMVKVAAVSLHKGDWHLLTGKPYLLRIAGFGLMRPKQQIPGMAIAGRVGAVGKDVTSLAVGDEVFGEIKGGGFAEYVCVGETEVARKPTNLTLEAAATLPVSATTALQGLRDAGLVTAGQRVLINGAAGGVGTFAVQMAKSMGAVVTGVCSAGNVEMVRGLGADHVVDYGTTDFTRSGERYDVILDLIGNHPLAGFRRALTPQGRLVAVAGGAEHEWVGPMLGMIAGLLSNLWSKQKFVPLMALPSKDDLGKVVALVDAGHVRPVIDKRYPLTEIHAAMRHLGTGHSKGKSVIVL